MANNRGVKRTAIRRERAEARQAERAKRSDAEQLQVLIDRGHPECSEALYLVAKIAGASAGV